MRKQSLSILEQITSEMEVYSDQRPESWQDSERGEAFTETMESVVDIADALRDISPNPSEA